MNKQELASRIWHIANDLRGTMEASKYKDYILGFIFYKYLSDNEYEFLIKEGYEAEDIKVIGEENEEEVQYIKDNLGYYIAPNDLYQNWIALGSHFTIDNVRTALSAFHRNISSNPHHQKVFGGIFLTLETGLSELGANSNQQTKQVRSLTELIQDIPTTHDEYDVLGYIYEYLIGKFAAGAGKSSGEFYTPGTVASFLAQTLANHLQDRETIEVYDPTSGSGSLLLDIGQSFELHQDSKDNVKYYAQEYINATERLTRMNLLMRGVKPANIVTRNGDSLEADFPYFDESDPEGTYTPVFVDAVVSNPPYSQKWDPEDKDHDPRFSGYGLAPKSKADYAFLLHGLYHVKPNGIMAIILPHGVLFRGGEEGEIRQKLIEKNNIDAVVGLPANIFFGTGIPTTILILKKERHNSDVLFVDASRGFEKDGNKNNLRPSDIKRLTDTVVDRKEIDNYSRLVSIEEIEENGYNLNIPRYVDSSDDAETWDVLATMNGGIPKSELDQFKGVLEVLPDLYDELFVDVNEEYVELKDTDIHRLLQESPSVSAFKRDYEDTFDGFTDYLHNTLIENVASVHPLRSKDDVTSELFDRYADIPLVDKYHAYGILDGVWQDIANDAEVIQRDSLEEAARAVDPNMVMKKKNGKEVEIQDGNKGRIFPYELIQDTLLKDEKDALLALEQRQTGIQEELTSLIETLSEDEGEFSVLNDNNDKFKKTETKNALKDEFETIDIPKIETLNAFQDLSGKAERLALMEAHPEISWANMALKKDGTPSTKGLRDYENELQAAYTFEEESFGYKLSKAAQLMDEETEVKKDIKEKTAELTEHTKTTIENLTDEQINELLYLKWIAPIERGLYGLVDKLFKAFEADVIVLHEKYATTMVDIQTDIKETSDELVAMMGRLTGKESDMKGIKQFQTLLGGEVNEQRNINA